MVLKITPGAKHSTRTSEAGSWGRETWPVIQVPYNKLLVIRSTSAIDVTPSRTF